MQFQKATRKALKLLDRQLSHGGQNNRAKGIFYCISVELTLSLALHWRSTANWSAIGFSNLED